MTGVGDSGMWRRGVARVVRWPPDSKARKSDYLRRDTTRARRQGAVGQRSERSFPGTARPNRRHRSPAGQARPVDRLALPRGAVRRGLSRQGRPPAAGRRADPALELTAPCLSLHRSGDQVLLVSFVVLAFLWGATEWVAWRLAFQPRLGPPWFEVFGWPLYQPPAFFWWWFAYDPYGRDIFLEGAYIAASGGIAAVIVAIALTVWRAREMKRVTTYGSARWAETREFREAGLLGQDGVLLGRWRDHYLRHDGPEHVLSALRRPFRQRRRSRRPHASDVARLGNRPRHQGRELDFDRRLARRVRTRSAVRSDQRGERRLQSAAGGPPWRVGGPRCPEHSRRPCRPRGRIGASESLGKDQPFAAGRRHPARALL